MKASRMSTQAVSGENIWAGAGDMSIAEAVEAYGSVEAAAQAAVEVTGGDVGDVVAYLEYAAA